MFAGRLLGLHLKRQCRACGQSPAFKNDVLDRILYNSVAQSKKVVQYYGNLKEKYKKQKKVEKRCDVEPVTLEYLDGYAGQGDESVNPSRVAQGLKDAPFNLPYSIYRKIDIHGNNENNENNQNNEVNYDCKYSVGFSVYCRMILRFFELFVWFFRRVERVYIEKLDE